MNNQKMALDHAIALMGQGQNGLAENILLDVLGQGDLDFYIRNNLGGIYSETGRFQAAYDILVMNEKEMTKLNPYYYARLSSVCFALDKKGEAVKLIKKGLKQFEGGNKRYSEEAWKDYGYTLMKSLAVLGKCKEGLKFYRSYLKHYDFNQIHLLATRLALILGRLDQAVVYAEKTQSPGTIDLVHAFEEELLPQIDLSYSMDELYNHVENPLLILGMLISDQVANEEKSPVIKYLMSTYKDDAQVIADKIFSKDFYDLHLKQAALDSLIDLGLHKQGVYKAFVYEGKEISLISGRVEVRQDDLISLSLLNEVEGLDAKEALAVIHEHVTKHGFTSPEIMIKEIDLFKTLKLEDAAIQMQEQLDLYYEYEKSQT